MLFILLKNTLIAVKNTEMYIYYYYLLLTMKLKCQRCGHNWDYKGKSKWYATCPMCKTSVNIKKQKK